MACPVYYQQYIISDAGTAYSSHEFHDFVKQWRVVHFMASVEHAATNGLVEKANGSLTATFVAYVNLRRIKGSRRLGRENTGCSVCHEYG
jgi:transposase InsO family protein